MYMIDEEGQPTGEPTSIFKMQGYANPSAFESDTVTEPIPALVDVVQDPKLQQRMNTIATRPSTLEEMKQQGITDPVKKHEFVVNRVLSDYMGTTKPDMEFRESIIRELQKNGSEFKPEEIDAFINNPSSNQELLSDIQAQAASVLADLTYTAPPVVSSPFEGKFEVQGRGGSIADAPYMVEVDRLREPVEISGGENLPGVSTSYTINGVGYDQTNGDILIPITYTEAEEINEELRGFDGIESSTKTTNKTLRIPAGKLDQADPLALEAYRNLPPSEQQRIKTEISLGFSESDENIRRELEAQQAQADASATAATPAQSTSTAPTPPPAQSTAPAATTASQPQQEETLDVQEMDPVEENFEDPVEDVDGSQLTPLAALPTRDASLIEQANEALRDPVMSTSPNYGPAVRAAEETLRDPQATDRSRERAVSTLQEIVNQRDRVAEGPERRERAAFESDAEGVDPQILEQYYNNVQPREYGLYPLPEGANIRGDQVVMDGQVVGSYESRMNPNTGKYVTGMRPMAVEPQSEFSRQAGEAVSNIASSASDLAADIRDNAGGNLRRAYDAAIETLGSAGSSLMDFIRGGGPTQQEVDRQRFEAARERQRLEEERPATSVPDPETVATPEPTRGREDVVDNIPVRPQPGSPRQAQAEAELRERFEAEEDRLIGEQGVTMATLLKRVVLHLRLHLQEVTLARRTGQKPSLMLLTYSRARALNSQLSQHLNSSWRANRARLSYLKKQTMDSVSNTPRPWTRSLKRWASRPRSLTRPITTLQKPKLEPLTLTHTISHSLALKRVLRDIWPLLRPTQGIRKLLQPALKWIIFVGSRKQDTLQVTTEKGVDTSNQSLRLPRGMDSTSRTLRLKNPQRNKHGERI